MEICAEFQAKNGKVYTNCTKKISVICVIAKKAGMALTKPLNSAILN